jgi:hypothetical protein
MAIASVPLTADESSRAIYAMASLITGAPAETLEGIAVTESDEMDSAVGDDGISMGRFQINETFRAERVRSFGTYNPRNPVQAAILTGRIYMVNLTYFTARLKKTDPNGTWKAQFMAIAAHNQGQAGVVRKGIGWRYVGKVLKAASRATPTRFTGKLWRMQGRYSPACIRSSLNRDRGEGCQDFISPKGVRRKWLKIR